MNRDVLRGDMKNLFLWEPSGATIFVTMEQRTRRPDVETKSSQEAWRLAEPEKSFLRPHLARCVG
jgi:hypothetical protein